MRMNRVYRSLTAALIIGIGVTACDDDQPADAAPEIRNAYGAYLSARHADRRNDAAAASDGFYAALRRDPENERLQRLSFYAAIRAGQIERSLELTARLRKSQPTYIPTTLMQASAAMKEGEWDKAIALFERLPTSWRYAFVRTIARAWALAGQGKGDEALKAIDEIAKERELLPFYTLHRGLILEVLDRQKEADAWYRKTYKTLRLAPLSFVQAAAASHIRQGDRKLALKIIDTYIYARGRSYAMQKLRRTVAAGEDLPPLVTSAAQGYGELLFNLAGAAESRSSREALMWAQMSLFVRPESGASRSHVGDMQRTSGQYAAAIETLKSVPKDSPFSWGARLGTIGAMIGLERKADAIRMLEEMAKEEPERWDVLSLLGNLHRIDKNWKLSIDAYDRAVARIKKPGRNHWQLFFSRAVSLERAKMWPRAEADFKKALELNPDQPSVLNYLAYSWVERKENLREALAMLHKAVRLRPRDGAIIDSLGWAYYRLGQFERSVPLLERAASLSPRNWEINDHLGDAYWRTGRRSEARFQWQRASTMDPDPGVLVKIQQKLKSGLPDLKPSEPAQ